MNLIRRRILMKHIVIAIGAVVLAIGVAIGAQTAAQKPDPELKKLQVLVGHWTYELEYKPGPLGPGGNVSGELNFQEILGGFFFQAQWIEKGATGEMRGVEIYAYDPVNKNIVVSVSGSDGSAYSGTVSVSGNTVTFAGKFVIAGKQYLFKASMIVAADLMSMLLKADISVDGSTWTPWQEAKYTKVKPVLKK
jgi:hypothetical protein